MLTKINGRNSADLLIEYVGKGNVEILSLYDAKTMMPIIDTLEFLKNISF
jgi:hypothetical protein